MKKKTQTSNLDSFEALKELPGSVKKSITEDLLKGSAKAAWEELFGFNEKTQHPQSGELKAGEELDLKQETKLHTVEPGLDYAREVIHAERKIIQKENQETKIRLQEIQIELKKLIGASMELEVEFKDVSLEKLPVNPGKLHLNFFEWILSQIRRARMRIEDSAHWTKALTSKRSQRQYWALYKKHGAINFGLSGERVVATQVG